MTITAEKNSRPAATGARAASQKVHNDTYSDAWTKATEALIESRQEPDFDEVAFVKHDAAKFAAVFGLTTADVRQIARETRPVDTSRFQWLEAVNQRHDISIRTLRVAIAIFSYTGPHGYSWPSQKALARRAGYSDSVNSVRDVRRSIAELVALGAINLIKVKNLPKELSAKAFAAAKEGGSARSFRGSAYALTPVDSWSENAVMGASNPHKHGGQQPPYNLKGNPNHADAWDSPHTQLVSSPETLMTSSTSQSLVMGGTSP